jgi:hypothetical protein
MRQGGFAALVVLACAVAGRALSDPLYHPNGPGVLACDTEEHLYAAKSADSGAGKPIGCFTLSSSSSFEAMNRQDFFSVPGAPTKTVAMIYGRDWANGYSGFGRYFYVMRGDVEPLTGRSGEPVQATCDGGAGGEVDRYVVGRDGRVYLRRFMITTRCVNGRMRSFTRPLN